MPLPRCVSPPILTDQEWQLTMTLLRIPADWLQENHVMREKCKEMVQEIFDTLKGKGAANPAKSSIAGAALKKIIASTALHHPDKHNFMSALSSVVINVGDSHWRWKIGN